MFKVRLCCARWRFVSAPYRYGGRTPAGFDCSGFVGYVFAETAGVALPRRSEEMSRLGESLPSGQWAAGDLVFFNTLGRPYSHVGIYVGDGRFIHAPARRGRVRVESIADPYWAVRFNGARRLFSCCHRHRAGHDGSQRSGQCARSLRGAHHALKRPATLDLGHPNANENHLHLR